MINNLRLINILTQTYNIIRLSKSILSTESITNKFYFLLNKIQVGHIICISSHKLMSFKKKC